MPRMNARRKRTLSYEVVKTSIQRRIAEGGWEPGVRLPSERELVQEFGCARMTVHRALRELEAEGLIERRQGSGSYVAELHPISNLLQVRDIREEFVRSHPYERLASLYESRHNLIEALRVCEAFTKLAASGKMPRGAQRSADRKLPEFEARIQRYRRSLEEER